MGHNTVTEFELPAEASGDPPALPAVHVLSGVRYEHTPRKAVKWHPYADLFPWLEGNQKDELVADIRKNGVIEPIVFFDDMILDGRNRYMAAREVVVRYPRVDYLGNDPLAFVLARNLARRHLSDSQRAIIAAKLAKLPKGANQHTAFAAPSITQGQAAVSLAVSIDGVQRVRKVLDRGSPELVAAVETGSVSISAAAELTSLSMPDQTEAVTSGMVQERVKAVRRQRSEASRHGASGNVSQGQLRAQKSNTAILIETERYAAKLTDVDIEALTTSMSRQDADRINLALITIRDSVSDMLSRLSQRSD